MIGITLSSEQVRTAPPEIRLWIEHQVATSLGLQIRATDYQTSLEGLTICNLDELRDIFSLIQHSVPAVHVLFELGRKGASIGEGKLEGYRLPDIQHRAGLQTVSQVMACLESINQSLHRVRGTTNSMLCVVENGFCVVATVTQENLLRLWQELICRADIATDSPGTIPTGTPSLRESAFPNKIGRPAPFPAPGA